MHGRLRGRVNLSEALCEPVRYFDPHQAIALDQEVPELQRAEDNVTVGQQNTATSETVSGQVCPRYEPVDVIRTKLVPL
jgi:hypothetical protein